MKEEKSVFHFADNEAEGNLFFRVAKGGTHGETYQNIYAYNNLMWLWKEN